MTMTLEAAVDVRPFTIDIPRKTSLTCGGA